MAMRASPRCEQRDSIWGLPRSARNRYYIVDRDISVGVCGVATLAGPPEIDALAGVARVAIRSSGEAGDINVAATGQDLRDGKLLLKACRG